MIPVSGLVSTGRIPTLKFVEERTSREVSDAGSSQVPEANSSLPACVGEYVRSTGCPLNKSRLTSATEALDVASSA